MNIKIKITNKSNAKELDVNIESIIEIDLEDYVFCCVAGEIGNAIYDACREQSIGPAEFGRTYTETDERIPYDGESEIDEKAHAYDILTG